MKKSIIVLGMHRSGTSAMAGVLTKLGCYSGESENLYQADDNNMSGYFERRDIVICNEKLLSSSFLKTINDFDLSQCVENYDYLDYYGWLFGAWVGPLEEHKSDDVNLSMSRIIEGVNSSFTSTSIANVFKDPRFSLTYPLWKELFGVKPLVVLMLRNPHDVAKSLYERDGIPKDIALVLWSAYTKSAFKNTEDCIRLIVNYDELIDDTEKVMNDLCTFLIENDVEPKNIEDATQHIGAKFRHSNLNQDEMNSSQLLLFNRIANKDFEAINELEYLHGNNALSWQKILYVPAVGARKLVKAKCEAMQQDYQLNITRVARHPITGVIIKFVKWFKRDKSFAKYF